MFCESLLDEAENIVESHNGLIKIIIYSMSVITLLHSFIRWLKVKYSTQNSKLHSPNSQLGTVIYTLHLARHFLYALNFWINC